MAPESAPTGPPTVTPSALQASDISSPACHPSCCPPVPCRGGGRLGRWGHPAALRSEDGMERPRFLRSQQGPRAVLPDRPLQAASPRPQGGPSPTRVPAACSPPAGGPRPTTCLHRPPRLRAEAGPDRRGASAQRRARSQSPLQAWCLPQQLPRDGGLGPSPWLQGRPGGTPVALRVTVLYPVPGPGVASPCLCFSATPCYGGSCHPFYG